MIVIGMRAQQKVWQDEHAASTALPSLAQRQPSSAVVWFVDQLRSRGVDVAGKRVLDIGCGKGRNAIFLAEQGAQVDAVDYIPGAIDVVRSVAQEMKMSVRIETHVAAIDQPWDFPDNVFDLTIDCFSSIDIETLEGRRVCRDEMLRALKPSGYALVAVVSASDELESEIMREHPGLEPHSSLWPGSGKFQKNYTEEELRDFYNDFDILCLETVRKPARKLGRSFTATNLHLLLQKPIPHT